MVGIGSLFGNIFSKRVNLEASVENPVALILVAKTSAVKIAPGEEGVVKVIGKTNLGGRAILNIKETERYGLTAEVYLSRAGVEIKGPFKILAVKISSGALKAEELSLDYSLITASHSAVKITTDIAPGGGFLGKFKTSSAKIVLNTSRNGDYWIELEAGLSSVKVETPDDAKFVLEGSLPPGVTVSRKKLSSPSSQKKFRIRIVSNKSAITII